MSINWQFKLLYKTGWDRSPSNEILAIGFSDYVNPKILYLSRRLGSDEKIADKCKNLLTNIIRLLSGFTIEPKSIDKLKFYDFVRLFLSCSFSILAPFRYNVALSYSKYEEHSRADVVKAIHARLTMPISFIDYDELSRDGLVEICYDDFDELLNFSIASLVAGLLTSITRHGYYVRLITMHTNLLLQYYTRSKHILDTNTLLAYDTVHWFVKHAHRLREPEAAEYHYMIYDPGNLVNIEVSWNELLEYFKKFTYYNGDLGKALERLLEEYKNYSNKNNKQNVYKVSSRFFGRLKNIYNLINTVVKNEHKFDHVVIIATEQWSPLQALIITEASGAKEITVLYTQNILYQRLYEEIFRNTIKRCRNNGDKLAHVYPKINYILVSSTDVEYTSFIIENIVSKYRRDDILFVSQGPIIPAIKLYVEAIKYGKKAILS